MTIDQHVPVTVTVNNFGIALEGFGRTAIPTYKDVFADASRTYRRTVDMISDGFAADDVEVRAASAIFSQSPHAVDVKLLRFTLPPTQKYELVILDAVVGFAYKIKMEGEGFADTTCSYAALMADDEGDIATALVTLLNGVTDKNYTAAVDGTDPNMIVITANAAGDWFSARVFATSMISIAQTHADPGIATDLAAAVLEDDDWYYFKTNFNSSAMVLEASEFIESAGFKFYVADVVDSDVENTAPGGGDIADQLNDLGRKRTAYAYHRKPSEMMDAAWEGRLSPLQVGAWDAAYKTLVGVTADSFTATQTSNMDAKRCSYYKAEAGRSFTWNGAIANTDYLWWDVTVSLDFVIDLIQRRVLAARLALNKVAYTDEDIQTVIKGAVEGAVDIAKSDAHRIVALGTPGDPDDPEPTVTFPFVRDIDAGTRALRELPPGNVQFRLQGAVNVVPIDLTLTF